MDGIDIFLGNNPPKRLLRAFCLLMLLSLILCLFPSQIITENIMQSKLNSILNAFGGGKITLPPTSENIAAGTAIFSTYGISSDVDLRIIDGYKDTFFKIYGLLILISVLFCCLGFVISVHIINGIYRKINELYDKTKEISDGKEQTLKIKSDGEIERLTEEINILAKRSELDHTELSNERLFLQNFLSDFSHQLKTSLSAVRLNSDILSETKNLPEAEQIRLFGEIDENLDGMEELVTSALKLAKLNAQSVEYNRQNISPAEICKRAVIRISPMLRDKGICVSLSEDSTAAIPLDPLWICEAVENIIKNSADHSECKNIAIFVSEDVSTVTIEISDDGNGIPQSEIPKIFERFGKKSGSMSSVGIGMSISKRIVEDHGGEILIFSEVGRGTTFQLKFFR